jgi:uncharacterized surface protein with fasciclin (FAS1) repeats
MKTAKSFRHFFGGLVAAAVSMLIMPFPLMAEEKTLATFESEDCLEAWTSVNDGVMGGISKGGFSRTEQGTLIFKGELSLENNGGFASIRMKPTPLDLSGMASLVVKAKGDGRTYWLELRAANQMAASSYRAYLPTKAGEWEEISVPLADFKLQAFGRELPSKALDAAAVTSVGITLADKKAGPFELEIESMKASPDEVVVKTESTGTIIDVAKAAGGFQTLVAAVTAADLAGVLSGEGPFTVLAPTDEAFAKLPAGTVDTLLKPENRAQLVDILKNHVIAGGVTLAKALEMREGTTLQGSRISIKFSDGRVQIGNATLVKADIAASNGIIHVIDQVLLPSKATSDPLTPTGLIELAIHRGVPIFNNGDVEACAALYEITCEALRSMTEVPEAARKEIERSLQSARSEKSDRSTAWILRQAMDGAWEAMKEPKK